MLARIYWVGEFECNKLEQGELPELKAYAHKVATENYGWYAISRWNTDRVCPSRDYLNGHAELTAHYQRSYTDGYVKICPTRRPFMLFRIYDQHEAEYITPNAKTLQELMELKRKDYDSTQQRFYEIHNWDFKEDTLQLSDFFDMLEANTPVSSWDTIAEAYQRYQRLHQEEA